MRRLIVVSLMVVSLAACKRPADSAEEIAASSAGAAATAPVTLKTTFVVSDEQAAAYMLHGFSGLEDKQWRWVAKKFGVTLAEPEGAAQNGARLELKFAYPEVAFTKVGTLTLAATVNGQSLLPETYKAAGRYTYARDLAGSTFHGGPVTIEFTTDKALPPIPPDIRELSLIVMEVSLSPR